MPRPSDASTATRDSSGPSAYLTEHLPEHLRTHAERAAALAADKVARSARVPAPHAPPLLAAAQRARTARQRVVWLQRWGEAQVSVLAKEAPCRRGCAHCCHMAVHITSIEADLLAAASGRTWTQPANAPTVQRLLEQADSADTLASWQQADERVAGTPCPFLDGHECSVYEHRPFACRTHLSLADDDELCRLIEGVEVPVPRVDTRLMVGYFLSGQPAAVLADIRAFFAPASTQARPRPAPPAAKAPQAAGSHPGRVNASTGQGSRGPGSP